MNKSAAVWQTLQKHRLIALLDPKRPDKCVQVYEALAPMGVVLEVALRGEAAMRSIKAVLEEHPDGLILAGTVLTRKQAEEVVAAGVAGVVSADYVPAVVDACLAKDVMCIPGGLADAGKQLVQKAEHYGQSLEELREKRPWQWVYKVFPAMANPEATLATANAWRAVYPGLALVYTGGVTQKNVGQLARRDPDGLFCGSALTRFADEPVRMMDEATRWLDAIADGRRATEAKATTKPDGPTLPPRTSPVRSSRNSP